MRRILLVCLMAATAVFAQKKADDPSVLTLDRIYLDKEFKTDRFGPARWLEDGRGYTTLEPSKTVDGDDIILYHPQDGQREIIVAAEKLIPPGGDSPLEIEDYHWSRDMNWLLAFTNSRRVWRQNTRGDYWALNLNTGKLHQLGPEFAESTLMFAKFSPDSRRVAYVQKNNIYTEDLASGDIRQLTYDGSETIINGTFDWVYEEEFHMRDGFRWSPDSRFIAYWQLDASGIGIFYMANYTDSIYTTLIPLQYPKVGTTNSACRVGVIPSDGGDTRWMKVDGDPRNNYIPRMEWAAGSQEIVFQTLNRLQNTNGLMMGDIGTGETREILVEKDDAWTEVVDDLKWLDSGRRFTWVSERDGWKHVYVISRDGQKVKLITPGDYDVISVEHIDDQRGWLYFIASPEDPGQRYLFRTRLSGKGKASRLTTAGQAGWHSYQISPDAQWAIHTHSSFVEPQAIDLVKLPGHQSHRMLVSNQIVRDKVAALKPHPTEFFRIDVGEGVKLDGWMIKPPDFDASKEYPALFFVYGEPWNQTVKDYWRESRILWHLYMAQQGYLIVSVDNRGTPAPRGREWRKCVYGQIGVLASVDQAAAARTIGRWSFVDSTRMAIWGWSGGGSMTLNALFRYPEIYHTGMAVAPVGDQRLYDTIYQERYMGLPATNSEGYFKGSPKNFAHQLKGNLLIVHGTGDDNVHYQNSEVVINELIKHNKSFDMMAYPNRTHGIREGENTTRHLFSLLSRYLMNHMP